MNLRNWCSLFFVCLSAGIWAFGCGPDAPGEGEWEVEQGDGDETSYEDDATVVINPEREEAHIVTGDGDGCVQVDDACVDPEQARQEADDPHCDNPDARTDIIVEDGEVVDVICYPPKEEGTDIREVGENEDGDTEVPQTENGTVVTFGEDTNGEPIEGDVTVDSERTTIYGNGVDETIIDGNIDVQSNESRIRSLTVTGDVSYGTNSNNSSISFCKIEGNLEVESNEFTATDCVVFGDVDVSGNGARLINIGVGGEWEVNPNADCRGCYAFDDENEDTTVQDEEVGEDLTCGGDGENEAPDNGGPPGM